jgi:hypothetical protein
MPSRAAPSLITRCGHGLRVEIICETVRNNNRARNDERDRNKKASPNASAFSWPY